MATLFSAGIRRLALGLLIGLVVGTSPVQARDFLKGLFDAPEETASEPGKDSPQAPAGKPNEAGLKIPDSDGPRAADSNGSGLKAVPLPEIKTRVPDGPAGQEAEAQPPGKKSIPTIDLTVETDDLWQRLRNGFAMPNLSNDLVSSQQAWILARPAYLKTTLERGRRYLHYIVQELEKRGMPTELALLPMVESSYNPMAMSPARASGLWQFIPSTGKTYGLKQDWWSDERRDVVASTNAALDYLQFLYDMQGDWHLALASYNWGEGAVARAMAKNRAAGKPTDYMSLTMPAETRHYVPKLQALKNILARPELFGVVLPAMENRPYFKTIKSTTAMDVSAAARLAEMPLEEFRALNPAHNRPVLRGQGATSLVLPADKVDTFLSNLKKSDEAEKPLLSYSNYTLQKSDRLESVAARFGISVARLKQLNSLGPKTKVGPGFTLLVPTRRGGDEEEDIGAGLRPPAEALAPKVKARKGKSHGAASSSKGKKGKAKVGKVTGAKKSGAAKKKKK